MSKMTSTAPPPPQPLSPWSDSDTDSDTNTAATTSESLRHTDLSATIFESYTAITGSASPELSKIQSFLNSSRSGAASCLICLERIRISDPTWSCTSRCFAVFHLLCIQSWARQCLDLAAARAVTRLSPDLFPNSLQDSLWNCPKCRIEYSKTLIPRIYFCFCGKLENPPNDPWILPHSCGEVCGRPLKHSCGHHCLLLCHPGPCPSCPKLVKVRCFCGATGDVRRCGFKEFSCNGVCSKLSDCGIHRCSQTCHEGQCPPCQERGVYRCQCGKTEVETECSARCFRCEIPCEKLLGCGKHVCQKGCHPGECGECPLQGKRTCPCGKRIYEGMACDVSVPLCGATCDKKLSCGFHRCSERCHRGSCIETCRIVVNKSCRCGSLKKEVPCYQDLACERKCQRSRDCGRHACKRRCCDGDCPPCSEMPKVDIGWEHAVAQNGDKKIPKCNYCGKVIHGGITRLKQHLAHVSGEVAACTKVSKELMQLMQRHLAVSKEEKDKKEKKKEEVLHTLREEVAYGYGGSQYYGEPNADMNDPRFHGMDSQEMIDLQFAMKDSRRQAMMDEDMRRQSFSNRSSGAGGSGTTSTGMQYGPPSMPSRTSSLREQSKSRRSVEEDIRAMDPYAFRSQAATQKKLNTPSLKENFKKVGRAIGKWMMFNAISFNAADSGPYYQVMIDIIAEYGKGVKGPSGRQLAGEFLQFELDDLTKYIKDLRIKWPEYGCTIMCDGWSSRNRHPIVNFMVYCKGDMMFHKSVDATNKKKTAEYIYSLMKNVVEVIGKDNVVQIVTDNESSYKAAGKKMMKKYPNLFWSPCAAHCIDLMLEDIGDIPSVASLVRDAKKITSFIYGSNQLVEMMRTYTNGRELLRPGITRFATEFIAIESLIRHKSDLKIMFASTEWRELSYVRHRKREDQATEVSGIVLGQQFWKRAEQMVAAMEPLVLVLKIVDQEKKPTMPVIYDAMDRAKLGIKDSQVKEWKKIWDIIDSRWERQLHCHLHAAAYFLNPISRYGQNFSYDTEVRLGLKEVIKRLEPNVTNQAMALTEESIFSERKGSFGSSLAQKSITLQSAAEWWYHHGEDAPNLRKIALKVLSQTCSSSGCERNWSTFSLIHTKIRNRLAIEKLEMLVFVHYNLRLRVRSLIVKAANDPEYCPIDLNHIFDDQDILDPWIVETEPPLLDGTDEQWLENGLEDFATTQGRRQQEQTSGSRAKQKSPVYEVSEPSSPDSSGNDSDNGNGSNAGSHEMQSGSHDVSDDNDPTYAARRTWEQGYDQYYATQDTDHGNRVGIDAQRDHLNRVAGFPSQTSSDEHEHSRRSTGTFMETTNFGQHVVLPYTGYPQPYPQPFPGGEAPYLQRSFSTGPISRRESSRSRPSAPPLPLLPPASPYVPQPPSRWSRPREKSTSTSSGGYYDRQCSGSQSNQERGGSESSSSFGPTGHGYNHGWESATPSASYVRDPSLSTGEDSSQSQSQTNNQSHDYGSDLASSLFSFPQAQFYGQSSFGEGFEPHRRSYWH